MIELKDQLGRTVRLEQPAQRIVSLVPSQTELLSYFGLSEQTVGITKFCIHPDEWYQQKKRVGGTKNVHHDQVVDLMPDLIITNKEENTPDDIGRLSEKYPVYVSDVITLKDAYQMIRDVGILCGKEQKAVDLIDDIQDEMQRLPKLSGTVMYFIWRDPYMVCGSDNFINTMLEAIGLENVIKEPRYIEVSREEIERLRPDYVFLSTEPYPFSEKHLSEFDFCNAQIKIVDGELFSWYGSRMLKMRPYFQQLFN